MATDKEIKDWMTKYNGTSAKCWVKNGMIDVSGPIVLRLDLQRLPYKFNIVDGIFDVSRNPFDLTMKLESFINFPETVHSDARASGHNFTTLEHCPKYIDGAFDPSDNPLTTLKWLPEKVGGIMYISCAGKLKDPYEWRHLLFKNINKVEPAENISTDIPSDMNLGAAIAEIINKYIGKPEMAHIAIDELMTLGESLGFHYD